MVHPFEKMQANQKMRWFIISTFSSLVLMVVLNSVGTLLTTEEAPLGIISFELAGQTDKMASILASWDPTAKLHASFSLGLDFLFMLAYSNAIALGCILASSTASTHRWPLVALGGWLAWGQWIAAILDAIENWALTSVLFGAELSPWTLIANYCAVGKFSLVFLGLSYSLYGLVVYMINRWILDGGTK